MYIPQTISTISVARVSSLDVTLHEVAGINWHVLLPYTVFGAGLMTYSQYRLVRGQHILKQQAAKPRRKPQARSASRFSLLRLRPDVRVVVN
jgi:hypothetical protein